VEDNLAALKKKVRDMGADVGIAYDGDADRIGVIDDQGQVIWGDTLMLLFSKEILARKPGATMIGEVKCSQVMYDQVEKLGGKAIMWRTGHSLIKSKMKEVKAELAGEMSGHIFFADRYYGFDDAIYSSARLLEILAATDRPLSDLLADFPSLFSTPEIRMECPEEEKFILVEKVKESFKAERETIDIDGVRVLFEQGWALVRPSNTQPLLVLRFEAETKKVLKQIQRIMEDKIAFCRANLSNGNNE